MPTISDSWRRWRPALEVLACVACAYCNTPDTRMGRTDNPTFLWYQFNEEHIFYDSVFQYTWLSCAGGTSGFRLMSPTWDTQLNMHLCCALSRCMSLSLISPHKVVIALSLAHIPAMSHPVSICTHDRCQVVLFFTLVLGFLQVKTELESCYLLILFTFANINNSWLVICPVSFATILGNDTGNLIRQ